MDEVARTIAALENRQRGRQRMGALANAMVGPRAPATLETAVRQRWEDPNRLAAAQAGTKLIHQGMVNVLAPRPTVPTEQQGALEHAENQQHARAQMGLGPDLGGTVTPQMRLQAESLDPSLMAMKGGKLAAALAGMVSWHGGPNKWMPEPGFPKGRPSLEYIGTGEGPQAYGHGFYSGEAKAVGEQYRGNLSYKDTVRKFRDDLPDDADFEDVTELLGTGHFSEYQEKVIKALEGDDWLGFDYPSQAISAAYRDLDRYDASPALRAAVEESGSLYKLDIPDADVAKFLDWDAPLSEQSDSVQKAVQNAFEEAGIPNAANMKPNGESVYTWLASAMGRGEKVRDSVLKQRASELLRKHGIPGNKYFDQMSRGEGKGTRNYVVWDQDVLDRTKMLDDE